MAGWLALVVFAYTHIRITMTALSCCVDGDGDDDDGTYADADDDGNDDGLKCGGRLSYPLVMLLLCWFGVWWADC